MPRFFVSFNSADRVWVRHFVERLRIAFDDVDIFFDEATIKTGDEWWGVICRNIAQSNAMLYVLTNDFFRSKYCRAEFLEAQRLGVPTIPILARPHTTLPFSFTSLNFIDMTEWFNSALPEKIYGALNKTLRKDPNGARGTPIPHPDRSLPTDWDWPAHVYNPGWLDAPAPPPAPAPAPKIEVKPPAPPSKPKLPRVEDILPSPFEWCYVPGGEVTLEYKDGSYVPEGGQTFTVGPFYIAKYAITNAQYEVFVGAKDGYQNAGWWDFSEAAQQWRKGHSRAIETEYGGDTLPRTRVSWYDAMAFCRWLSAQTGENITLPTEQQWQLAAIGTDGRAYPWGNQAPTEELARFDQRLAAGPLAVDALPAGASPFGALNMAGNVWEWCITGYQTGDQIGNTTDTLRVLRGGSFYFTMLSLRGSNRYGFNPDYEHIYLGFRCARSY